MSGHTPGPWIAQADPNAISSDDWVIGIEGAPIDYVATCWKRDARLIAGAPELLGALVELLEVEEGDLIGADFRHAINKAKRNARTAIAKATGVQP